MLPPFVFGCPTRLTAAAAAQRFEGQWNPDELLKDDSEDGELELEPWQARCQPCSSRRELPVFPRMKKERCSRRRSDCGRS